MNKEFVHATKLAYQHIDIARGLLEVLPENSNEDALLYDALRALEMPCGEDFQNSVKRRLYQYLNCGPVEQNEKPKPRTFVQDVWRAGELLREEFQGMTHADLLAALQMLYDAGRESMIPGEQPEISDTQVPETSLQDIAKRVHEATLGRASADMSGLYTAGRPMNPVFDGSRYREKTVLRDVSNNLGDGMWRQ